ncbi:MAG TPA: LysR family transcriptional regulator, partial [Steroidobacteraceae bacterium]|nr:LysR family transcriptional regulator [Steroidobacteraceae bacterium]
MAVTTHLRSFQALELAVRVGSLKGAADVLSISPAAVGQRIKALEQRVGQVLVIREKPCVATAAGAPLLRLAAQTALLEAEAESYHSKGTCT